MTAVESRYFLRINGHPQPELATNSASASRAQPRAKQHNCALARGNCGNRGSCLVSNKQEAFGGGVSFEGLKARQAGCCLTRLHLDFAEREADLELVAHEPVPDCLIEQEVELFFSLRRIVTLSKNPCAYDANIEVLLKVPAFFPERFAWSISVVASLKFSFHKERTCQQSLRVRQ